MAIYQKEIMHEHSTTDISTEIVKYAEFLEQIPTFIDVNPYRRDRGWSITVETLSLVSKTVVGMIRSDKVSLSDEQGLIELRTHLSHLFNLALKWVKNGEPDIQELIDETNKIYWLQPDLFYQIYRQVGELETFRTTPSQEHAPKRDIYNRGVR